MQPCSLCPCHLDFHNADDPGGVFCSEPLPCPCQTIRVVASIKPVHSLVSAVMYGVALPKLIVDGNASPHSFSLKPSQANLIENAQLVFWIGAELEPSLTNPIDPTREGAAELIDGAGIQLRDCPASSRSKSTSRRACRG